MSSFGSGGTAGFWGIQNDNYIDRYIKAVNKITSDAKLSKKALEDLKSTGYVSNTEDIIQYAFDKKVGPVHKYIKEFIDSQDDKESGNQPQKYKYTHTTDPFFYDTMFQMALLLSQVLILRAITSAQSLLLVIHQILQHIHN